MNGIEQAFTDGGIPEHGPRHFVTGVHGSAPGVSAHRVDGPACSPKAPHTLFGVPGDEMYLSYPVEVTSWDPAIDETPVWGGVETRLLLPEFSPKQQGAAPAPVEPSPSGEEGTEDGTADADEQVPKAEQEPFKPAWEVDRFMFPAEVERLYEQERSYFEFAGQKLRDAGQEGLKVLGVAAAKPGAGGTTLAVCLAHAVAATGFRVALLDANFRRPDLSRRLGIQFGNSWWHGKATGTSLADCAILALDSQLVVLPLGDSSVEDGGSLWDGRAAAALRTIRAAVDLVIVDLGAAAAHGRPEPADSTEPLIDAAIVVRDVRNTSELETVSAAGLLRQWGIEAVGIAENFVAKDRPSSQRAA